MRLKTLAALSALLMISGCSFFESKPQPVEIRTIEIPIKVVHPALPRELELKSPQFMVVSKENIDEFLKEMEDRNGLVFIAITIDDYELMSYNVQELKRYIEQLKQVVVYYRNIDTDKEK